MAEELSLTRASQRLFVSQPTLSRLVKAIEHEVGVPLFERQPRGLSLTSAGRAFVHDAALVIAELEGSVERARAAHRDALVSDPPVLRVGLFYPSAAELTRPILDAFARRHPATTVVPVDITALLGERALITGAVDVAFLWSPITGDEIDGTPLFADPCVALLPRGHRLSERAILSAPDLAAEPYTVTRTLSPRWQAASTLRPWRHRLDKAIPVDTVTEALQMVAAGRAVGVGPLSLSRWAPVAGIRYVPLAGQAWPVSMLCRRRGDHRGLVTDFVSMGASLARRHVGSVVGARPT